MPRESYDNPRRLPKWPFFILFTGLAMFLVFKLFEPVFVYNSGWTDLPADSTPPFASSLKNEAWQPAAASAEEHIKAAFDDIEAPGISVAISKDGSVIWQSTIGYANLESRTALNSGHQFRLGSSSKAVTSIAVGRLLDKSLLELDAPIGTWESSLPEKFKQLTLRQIMSHRAGIRNYGMCLCFPVWEHKNRREFENVRESVDLIAGDAFIHEPAGDFQYTSLGYNVAGLAVEKASGLSFSDALKREIFKPLGMGNSELELSARPLTNSVDWYDVQDGQFKPAFTVDNSIRWPSGGIVSTPTDMALLGSAMLDKRLLSEKTRDALVTIPESGRSNGGEVYALGWRVGKWTLADDTEVEIIYHNGVAVGSVSIFMIFPEHGLVVSAMSNNVTDSADDLSALVKGIIAPFVKHDRSAI